MGKHWGHEILGILGFAPFPFGTIASVTNAAWYTVEGDYAKAGLSLVAAVPGLAYAKVVKAAANAGKVAEGAKSASTAATVAARFEKAAKATAAWRPGVWRACSRAVKRGGITLTPMAGWSKTQMADFKTKVKYLSDLAPKGKLEKTKVERLGNNTRRYKSATGKTPEDGQNVDHLHELQLGGADDPTNMTLLDESVNKSVGIQIAMALRDLPYGTTVPAVAACVI